jgi:murein DD-endopeptidase MepM/ murein hydrolase activator NlpD
VGRNPAICDWQTNAQGGLHRRTALLVAFFLTGLVVFAGCGPRQTKRQGLFYTVESGDTLTAIAALHQTDVQTLMRANGIENPDQIERGRKLWIPDGQPLECLSTTGVGGGFGRAMAKGIPLSNGAGRGKQKQGYFVWPVAGRPNLSSGFGPRWGKMHRGLDFSASPGTQVRAARTGQVVHVGENGVGPGRSYGHYVVIHHGDGLYTLYAHLRDVSVREGDKVATGKKIGEVGSSGRSTGPHLHFEVIEGVTEVNPLSYLPQA